MVDNIRTADGKKEKLSYGDYWLHVPADVMIFEDETYDLEFVRKFTFSPEDAYKLANASKTNGRVRVYNAQGILTRDEKDTETALRVLRRGIYIINGKKFIVK